MGLGSDIEPDVVEMLEPGERRMFIRSVTHGDMNKHLLRPTPRGLTAAAVRIDYVDYAGRGSRDVRCAAQGVTGSWKLHGSST
ncbi:hypothetical protein SPHINGO391_510183 [Sphingomonas aurantiaca]|jgi:hypothetical protein|uniref:Uncharacterized protein n=1 Tax=Sphingomonas aurantiaca TaxID=185949 RepID=A0A5E8AK45_9SPHN|nr:hypothetical protein SPHINGO391_510183 [Sphingomonas aurantiaca]